MSLYDDATRTKAELLAARAVLRDNLAAHGISMPETASLMELAAAFNQVHVNGSALEAHNIAGNAHDDIRTAIAAVNTIAGSKPSQGTVANLIASHDTTPGAHSAAFAQKADLVTANFNHDSRKRLHPSQSPIVVRSEAVVRNIEPAGNGETVFYDISNSESNEVMIDPVFMDAQNNYARLVVLGKSMGATQKEVMFYGNVKVVKTNGWNDWITSTKSIVVDLYAVVPGGTDYFAIITQFGA